MYCMKNVLRRERVDEKKRGSMQRERENQSMSIYNCNLIVTLLATRGNWITASEYKKIWST